MYARIAQLVEQKIENLRVGGSIPPPGTTFVCKNKKISCFLLWNTYIREVKVKRIV